MKSLRFSVCKWHYCLTFILKQYGKISLDWIFLGEPHEQKD